ncbi:GNAT family N-acetyltransferase [Salinicola avicenniae]|uniref:GNAT family N-acetyltransferase n=1 Tax=Salinicola avicenniae TaxID=2916836 RepID=UPI0020733201|nr:MULTISPECIES: GNAT family N-acetyltransferase [unclassified Salinicola]
MEAYDWRWSTGPTLDPRGLYDLLALREAIFVVEQRCPYPELDGRDLLPSTHHLEVRTPDTLVATLRLLVPATLDEPVAIGRVAIHADHRGGGLGHALLRAALTRIETHWPGRDARLSAQAHLQRYYGRHGFVPTSEVYREDGIPHVDMHRAAAPR